MKKTGILNSELSSVIAAVGHTDLIVVCDSGYPIPKGTLRIDLALRRGSPGIVETVAEMARELEVEKITFALESGQHCAGLIREVQALFPGAGHEGIGHDAFKALAARAVAIVRTGECIPYANVILHAGVAF
ncbi:D-ribose pyranase [Cohnella sp. 56]|uniref:D-ribose pyranase n=1 Tax=Cohnella sp. 56 TaxID=3113722 RepID=UPI0030E8ED51